MRYMLRMSDKHCLFPLAKQHRLKGLWGLGQGIVFKDLPYIVVVSGGEDHREVDLPQWKERKGIIDCWQIVWPF